MASLGYEGAPFDIFNLGESETILLADLITAIEETLGRKAKSTIYPSRQACALTAILRSQLHR